MKLLKFKCCLNIIKLSSSETPITVTMVCLVDHENNHVPVLLELPWLFPTVWGKLCEVGGEEGGAGGVA